jgi:hypothetical protein
VLGLITKETGVGSAGHFQIKNSKDSSCWVISLQGDQPAQMPPHGAARTGCSGSRVADTQLRLKLVLLVKAGKGRAKGEAARCAGSSSIPIPQHMHASLFPLKHGVSAKPFHHEAL